MSGLQVLDIGLASMVLAVAGWTIFAREAFAAVVGYVAYGLLLRSSGCACSRPMWR